MSYQERPLENESEFRASQGYQNQENKSRQSSDSEFSSPSSESRYPNREGGYVPREGNYQRDNHYPNRERGYAPREGNYHRDNRYPKREGGYAPREGNYQRPPRQNRASRRQSPPISIQESLFLLPEHPLTQDFQRAIGMAKGTILEVDPRKKRGTIEIEGFKYKFEDERRRDLQNKYPIQKFLEREIMFAFWPTYSQKAAQYRQIDEAPTIKISNLRRTLPVENAVEIIGEVLMVEENLFVMSVFSASQKKKYMVTIMGSFPGESGTFIQMLGELKNGEIVYKSHRNLTYGSPPEAIAQTEA